MTSGASWSMIRALNEKKRHYRRTNPFGWPLIVILTVMITNIHFVANLTAGGLS
jgi:hypothetical protein